MDAQRVKTRGPNPNPTAQAQSKRCLPLFTQTQILSKMLSFLVPFSINFGTFSYLLLQSCQKGPGLDPKWSKVTKIDPKLAQVAPRGAQMEPKWAPGVPKWSPKLSQNTGKHIQSHFKVPLGLQNVPQSVFEVKAASSGFELQAKSLPRPGARRRRRRSGRGLEGRAHQAARRRPRSGAEAGIRGHK